jgi:hypothetical protein
VPEQAWNEDQICIEYYSGSGSPLCSGGGGTSTLFAKPTWQTGVPGLSSSITMREVPDIALAASIYNPGYLFCTSDQSAWQSGQAASCNQGFLDSSSGNPTAAGGTSFAAPIFAGMVAILNQQKGYTTGQGLVNSTLYKLASDSTTYASAFHDIGAISGSTNACENYGGSSYCSSSGESSFATTTGYDEATGLGSVDFAKLAGVWPASTGTSLIATTTSITAANSAPTINVSDNFTISVTSTTGSTIPTGTVDVSVDGGTAVTETLTANGTYVYSTTFTTAGTHTVTADYSGDTTHASSSASATITAAGTTSGSGSFSISATNITVAQGSAGTSTITVKPTGGYTGTVVFSLTTTNSALANACNGPISNAVVTGTASVTTTVTVDTNAANCLATGAYRKQRIHVAGMGWTMSGPGAPIAAAFLFLIALLAGILGRHSRKLRVMAGVILLATFGLAFTGCGSNGSSSVSNPPKGSYTLTLTGTDSVSTTIPAATTTLTLTIQ